MNWKYIHYNLSFGRVKSDKIKEDEKDMKNGLMVRLEMVHIHFCKISQSVHYWISGLVLLDVFKWQWYKQLCAKTNLQRHFQF